MAEVEVLTDVPSAEFPAEWYEIATPDHFWFEWRFRALRRQIEKSGLAADRPARVLEIGCGHGVVRAQLEAFTRWTVDGCDLNRDALRQNGPGRGRTFLYDIRARTPSLRRAYDALVVFDVLEHVEDTATFLDAALFHLKNGGLIFINVPALNGLLSEYDRVVGHVRRYDRESMQRALAPHALHVVDLRYWGFAMVPLLWLRARQRFERGAQAAEVIRRGISPPNGFFNGCLKGVMHAETALISKPPLGTSLMAVCQYQEGAAPA